MHWSASLIIFARQKTIFFAGLIALFAATVAPYTVSAQELPKVACEELLNKADVSNFAKVSSTMWRGAQPSDHSLEVLAQGGIKTVIDLRMEGDDSERENKKATELGMVYVHIPLGFTKPPSEKILSFLKTVTDPACQPVFVHCRQGADRTGTFCAIYRRLIQGWSFDQCWPEMRQHHFKPFLASLKKTVQEFSCEEFRHLLAAPQQKMAASPVLPSKT
jgi:protein tyrosine phosphatase (PTP) superfamily phosphohydrolase (DUF442 family)